MNTVDPIQPEWEPAPPPFEVEQTLVQRFEQQVEAYRDRLAVKTSGHELTYEALNRRANRIAAAIIAAGTPGAGVVAILLDHDAPLIAAILGVLKSGHCYVAMEPSHPVERLRSIADDSQAALLITDRGNLRLAGDIAGPDCALLDLDGLGDGLAEVNPGLEIAPSALAHMVYTSGSTGVPKGVCQTHRNVLHNVRNFTRTCDLDAADRFSLLSLCCYAPAVTDTFAALLNGAALLPFRVAERGPAELGDWLRREKITIYHSVPLVFRNLVAAAAGREGFPDVRLIKLGGEAVLRSDVELFRQHFSGNCRLYVGLGTSETNIIRCIVLDKHAEFEGNRVPAGYAVDGKEVMLLDDSLREVPDGETGEIVVRSPYLFTGYWRRPELTAATWIADPRGSGERVFRTGDLGRMLPDGVLLHLGRKDAQIKVRGVRIEPSEVESACKALSGVRDCVVTAVRGEAGDNRLVAYLVAAGDAAPDATALRRLLIDRLPAELIPGSFVWLDRIPLTPNGKVDRRALPPPDTVDDDGSNAAADMVELKLVQVWQRLFQREAIGRHDDFFELGGHSLLAAQLVAEIESFSGHRLPVSALLQTPTVESLARRLTDSEWAPRWSSLVPLQTLGSAPPLFVAHGWGGDLYWFDAAFREAFGPDQPVYGLQAIGLDGRTQRHTSVQQMASHYVREIRALQPEGPYHLAGYSLGGLIAMEIGQQLWREGQRVAFLGLLDTVPRSVPWGVYLASLAPLFGQRCKYHLQRLRSVPLHRAPGYLLGRWEGIRKWKNRNRRRSSVVTGAPDSGDAPPQVPGFRDYYQAVASSYSMRRYPGSIDVFLSETADAVTVPFWSRLARSGARLHRLSGDHYAIVGEQHSAATAGALKAALQDAQANSGCRRA